MPFGVPGRGEERRGGGGERGGDTVPGGGGQARHLHVAGRVEHRGVPHELPRDVTQNYPNLGERYGFTRYNTCPTKNTPSNNDDLLYIELDLCTLAVRVNFIVSAN